MLREVLSNCDLRYKNKQCDDCSYGCFCPNDCEKCLDYIHNATHAPAGAPIRKYDCAYMADFYTCKYSCRYTSEIMYAIERCDDLHKLQKLKVLSFGCGPCTDLFAIDELHKKGLLSYQKLEYHGIDYSKNVWQAIHKDIKNFKSNEDSIDFFYENAVNYIYSLATEDWTPNVITFQYVFSDMKKHTDGRDITKFIKAFADYYNTKVDAKTYIILNDINLSQRYNGGREYFDELFNQLNNSICKKGRFCDDNANSPFYPRGYTYGSDSDGEFPYNKNRFDLKPWVMYAPFNTCASAQMIIKKVAHSDN